MPLSNTQHFPIYITIILKMALIKNNNHLY